MKVKNVRKFALLTLLSITSGAAQADLSANLGFASDYYYRGIFQASSAVSAGLDFDKDGFFAGAWAADVNDGLEVDGYFGYAGRVGEIGYGVGYTGYFYTGDFDDTYQEINIGGAIGLVSVDIAIGEYDNFTGPKADYTFYSLTVEKAGFYGKFGGFSQDFNGEYFEAGYGTSVADFDLGINLILNDRDLSGDGSSDQALIVTVGKSFDL